MKKHSASCAECLRKDCPHRELPNIRACAAFAPIVCGSDRQAIECLAEVLEWAKGNRGSTTGNPYCVAEVKKALKYLATVQNITPWTEAITTVWTD